MGAGSWNRAKSREFSWQQIMWVSAALSSAAVSSLYVFFLRLTASAYSDWLQTGAGLMVFWDLGVPQVSISIWTKVLYCLVRNINHLSKFGRPPLPTSIDCSYLSACIIPLIYALHHYFQMGGDNFSFLLVSYLSQPPWLALWQFRLSKREGEKVVLTFSLFFSATGPVHIKQLLFPPTIHQQHLSS